MIESIRFRYDVDRYGEDVEKLSTTAQFVAPVVVGRQRILRTRAKFDCPWSIVGIADVDPEQVDKGKLTAWLATGGRRVGPRRLEAAEKRPLRAVRRREGDRAAGRRLRAVFGSPRMSRRGVAWRAGAWHALARLGGARQGTFQDRSPPAGASPVGSMHAVVGNGAPRHSAFMRQAP